MNVEQSLTECVFNFHSLSCIRIEPYLSCILKKPVFDVRALQEYIFICCQRQSGGLIDKPDT